MNSWRGSYRRRRQRSGLFTVADTLRVFAEVYDNQVQTPHEVDISTMLRAEDGLVVFRAEEQRSTDELQGTPGGYGHIVEIPLAEVAPGEYLLRVEARSRLAGTEPVAREILVHVVPPPRLPTEAAAAPTSPLQVVNVVGGVLSDGDEARTVVARSDAEWQAVWSSLGVRGNMPQVTFENTMIVAVFLGTRPSAGYAVDVVNAVVDGDVLVVQYAERQPPAGTAYSGCRDHTTYRCRRADVHRRGALRTGRSRVAVDRHPVQQPACCQQTAAPVHPASASLALEIAARGRGPLASSRSRSQ